MFKKKLILKFKVLNVLSLKTVVIEVPLQGLGIASLLHYPLRLSVLYDQIENYI